MAVLVSFYGTRGSCPCAGDCYATYGGNTSCVLVDVGDEMPLILDAGTGLRALGAALRPGGLPAASPIKARMLLTHLHFDHLLGLPFYSPLEDPGALLEVYGPNQGECGLHEVIDGAVTPPFFPVQMKEFNGEIRLIELGAEDFALGDAKIKARWIEHTGPTLGFRIEANNVSLAYLPDHQAPLDGTFISDAVLELCDGVDLLIHDAQYSDEEFARKPTWGHSTVAYAVHVGATAGVKQLVLFHHDPAHNDEMVGALEEAATTLPGSDRIGTIVSAREGVTIDLGS